MSSSSKKDGQHSQTKWVEISVGDTTIPVYVCTPAQGKPKGAILVFQEVFGVNSHIRSVAERCAAEGYLALAPDLFHRQGHRYEAAYSDIKSAAARSQLMSEEQLLADIDRVIATLDERMKIGVLGFCLGGRIAFQAAFHPRVSAAVTFYASRLTEKALQWTEQLQCPLLMFFGENDNHITQDDVSKIREKLHEHSKEAEIVIYPHAGHGFFCEERDAYQERAAQNSWQRVLKFMGNRL